MKKLLAAATVLLITASSAFSQTRASSGVSTKCYVRDQSYYFEHLELSTDSLFSMSLTGGKPTRVSGTWEQRGDTVFMKYRTPYISPEPGNYFPLVLHEAYLVRKKQMFALVRKNGKLKRIKSDIFQEMPCR